jgi:hypothetical protein
MNNTSKGGYLGPGGYAAPSKEPRTTAGSPKIFFTQNPVEEIQEPKPLIVSCLTISSRSDAFANIEHRFLRSLRECLLQEGNIELVTNEYRDRFSQGKYILALCLKVTRLGTDVDYLRRDIPFSPGEKNIVLVTFNHIAQHVSMGVPTRDQLPEESRRVFNAMFDARCWSQAGGLYECPENAQLIQDVARYIKSNWLPDNVTD